MFGKATLKILRTNTNILLFFLDCDIANKIEKIEKYPTLKHHSNL